MVIVHFLVLVFLAVEMERDSLRVLATKKGNGCRDPNGSGTISSGIGERGIESAIVVFKVPYRMGFVLIFIVGCGIG